MGCASCGQRYRGRARTARTRFQRVGRKRTPMKIPEEKASVTVQQQQEAPINVAYTETPVDHATGTPIAVIKEGYMGERHIPNTLPQPENPVVVDTPKES
mgnify:CR=1 FL=1